MVNKVILIGNLGRDPELFHTQRVSFYEEQAARMLSDNNGIRTRVCEPR